MILFDRVDRVTNLSITKLVALGLSGNLLQLTETATSLDVLVLSCQFSGFTDFYHSFSL